MKFHGSLSLCPALALLFAGCGSHAVDDPGTDAFVALIEDAASLQDTGNAVDAFVPVDAPEPAEACSTVGETRVGPCGRMCGQASQRCNESRVWENTSACLMEGECARGTAEMRPMGMCGEETRLCQNDCSWTAWETSRLEAGECSPGQLRFVRDETRCGTARGSYEVCGDSCTFEPGSGTCTDGCGDTARTTPEWAREVCVPAGTFIRGYDIPGTTDVPFAPEREIYLSAYYIDAYPVTNGRYRACADDPGDPPVCESIPFFSREDYPMEPIDSYRASLFCAWDRGRQLPTEAQWEKAARGPSPRRNLHPWDVAPDCDDYFSVDCGYMDPGDMFANHDSISALPVTRSYYGTFMQFGAGREWTRDYFSSTYYSMPESTVPDPTGPSTGTVQAVRGTDPRASLDEVMVIRGPGTAGAFNFRCVRSVEVTP